MIELCDFDFDRVNVSIRADGNHMNVVVKSAYTPDAMKAAQYFSMCCNAAKEQGIALDEEVDNFGVKVAIQTETYKKLVAQYAEKLVDNWPVDAPLFECLLNNQDLSWVIINKSNERAEDFLKKKNK